MKEVGALESGQQYVIYRERRTQGMQQGWANRTNENKSKFSSELMELL